MKRSLEVSENPAAECCVPIATDGMSADEAASTAALFRALADPHRVQVVNLLAVSGEPVCVCDLTTTLALSQPTVSFHMKKLVEAGLLDREQRGVWAYYSLRPDAVRKVREILKF
jgi:ArsR family transcriptional regulator, arsenate/arsenite/antimonite-responsive transcriptional repressor